MEGVDLAGWRLAQRDLTQANFGSANLAIADLSQANLAGAWLGYSHLKHVDLTDALGTDAGFWDTTSNGFTKQQLYSTASYKTKQRQGINLGANNPTGWEFAGHNLAGAYISLPPT